MYVLSTVRCSAHNLIITMIEQAQVQKFLSSVCVLKRHSLSSIKKQYWLRKIARCEDYEKFKRNLKCHTVKCDIHILTY